MRRHIAVILSALLLLAAACGGLLLAGCGTTSSSTAASSTPTEAPPSWLLAHMAQEASNAGDPGASGWWTLTTADKAVVVEGDDAPSPVGHPHKAVYVAIVHGNFTRWLWSLPPGASPPPFSWIAALIDARSHITSILCVGDEPFATSGLQMHPVELSLPPATQLPSTTTTAQRSSAPAWLQRGASFSIRGFTAASAVDSVVWTKTTWGKYELAIGGHGDATSTRPAYVVVAHGEFTSIKAPPPTADRPTPAPMKGRVLVVTFDAVTHEIGNIDLLYSDTGLKASVFGEMSPMSLPTD